ncbi:MAG TPA: matrixin family metalloprotease [Planctomycetota bacterium]
MNTKLLLPPALALGGAALLLVPVRPSAAFSKIGGSLGEGQRDVRVFDNFLDATANDNANIPAMFPGWTGAEQAVWKGIVEWGSTLHGDGSGDPQGGNLLGNGGANFDAFWSGNATSVGSSNNNIASSLADCGGGGTLAFCETPISDGWRIRFCDEWNWDDGPGTIGTRFDIQGVMAHEYGHALGLGHSGTGLATMAPSVGAGSTSIRSIHADDTAGIQCIYGVASGTKPVITATVGNPGGTLLTIHGSNFPASNNEVWFTSDTSTATGSDPIVRVLGVNSANGGTLISVAVPANAGPGDVIVNGPGSGGNTLSNAFPTDLVNTFGMPPATGPAITNVSPSSIPALIPGTAETISITGTGLDLATQVLVDGSPVDPARFTIVGPTSITLDMPQVNSLGAHSIGVTDGSNTSTFPVSVVAVTGIVLQAGTGDPGNVVDRDDGLTFHFAGTPGKTYRLVASLSGVPSVAPGVINLSLGNNFQQIFNAGNYLIPAAGWLSVTFPSGNLIDPGPGGRTFYNQMIDLAPPSPYETGNLQTFLLVQ